MRHPIYTSLLIIYTSTALALYSPRNVVLIAIGMFWLLLKSVVEERFLREDPQYAAYMQKGALSPDTFCRLTGCRVRVPGAAPFDYLEGWGVGVFY